MAEPMAIFLRNLNSKVHFLNFLFLEEFWRIKRAFCGGGKLIRSSRYFQRETPAVKSGSELRGSLTAAIVDSRPGAGMADQFVSQSDLPDGQFN